MRLFRRFNRLRSDDPSQDLPLDQAVLATAEALAAQERFAEAIAYATIENHRLRDPVLERRLVQWRQHGAAALSASPGRPDWPPPFADPFPGAAGLPEIHGLEALTAERLGGAILHHGSLIVRGLLSTDEVEQLKSGISNALGAFDLAKRGHATPESRTWYSPIPLPGNRELAKGRAFAESQSAVWTADSPRMLFNTIDLFKSKGIDRVIGEYLGEHPLLSVGKSTLRRVVPLARPGGWHQDGAFLGAACRTVDLWVSLSHCGDDAPGLDIVPRRLQRIVETGTHGAEFDWTVGNSVAQEAAAGKPTASAIYRPGDAVLFDHMNLHQTSGHERFRRDRYAMETWFFAPSTFPRAREALLL